MAGNMTGWAIGAMLAMLAQAVDARTLIHAGHLIDGVAKNARSTMTIIIDGERIVGIEDGFVQPDEGDTLIDLSAQTVLPGLLDMHTHLDHQNNRRSYMERFTLNGADYALMAAYYAKVTLHAGFTTVRDLGGSYNAVIALRKAIERGEATGPRIFSAGKSIATTGGHGDPTNSWAEILGGDPGPADGVVNGPAEAAKAVRQRYKDGADLIKITATGGVLSAAKSGQNPQFRAEELEALMATARDYGFHVAAHAHGAEGMKRAIRAGVRSIEHGTYMDDEAMALMKKHGTYFVPTLSAGKFIAEKAAEPGYFPEMVRAKAAVIGPVMQTTFARAYRNGVTIAFGTDSGVGPHGENAKEFVYMVEGGMPAMAAIMSATSVAAELLEETENLGSIRPGTYADIIAVGEDPLRNISALQNVVFVMQGGVVVKDEIHRKEL
ncbi:MAG: amidohydrolase family protein [Gammaproteobacteria bacterium]|nr:MAG: amidohydrolase family protein [Gammaproteobacteria bacterium]